MAESQADNSKNFHIEKDLSKAFDVEVAEYLHTFVDRCVTGNKECDFSAAGLVLQAASSGYGKKVECLYDLCSDLKESVVCKSNNGEISKANPKEKAAAKRRKVLDSRCSTEFKVGGANLSALSIKSTVKKASETDFKAPKKRSHKELLFVPVDLLQLESEEKGDLFYDTKGKCIGYRNDFLLNRCTTTRDGWLLLPGVCPSLIPIIDNITNYKPDLDDCDNDMPCGTDEGYPTSPSTQAPSTAPDSQVPSTQDTDEGVGSMQSTPREVGSTQAKEGDVPMGVVDIKVEDLANGDVENASSGSILYDQMEKRITRQSTRLALSAIQNAAEKKNTATKDHATKDDMIASHKQIQKKSTIFNPTKLHEVPISVYCQQTFFPPYENSEDDEVEILTQALAVNKKCVNRIKHINETLRAAAQKRKENADTASDDDDDEEEDESEVENEAEPNAPPANPSLEYEDFEISGQMITQSAGDFLMANTSATERPVPQISEIDQDFVDMETQLRQLSDEQLAEFEENLENFHHAEVSEKVREWQAAIEPFLEEIKKREPFDINLYGSHILESFPESSTKNFGKKQPRMTKTFKEFCKGMNKWEVHRYFMALLPLANSSNVELKNEPSKDDKNEEDITITLLSKKVKEVKIDVAEGHSSGEHP